MPEAWRFTGSSAILPVGPAARLRGFTSLSVMSLTGGEGATYPAQP